ncbi:LacI family DNA-binding transcriptional regulator [Hoyosella sp. G463]|uniref:LacI family DNA-binding transcriptional regulator n=1 Tax=Lolliginicoccus lacisalsi TaxID=2742202 RepID=A0A927JBN8_9ACTN|nr:LacI family DNA-binding transcriptional regulator [Lolliginicoccus lacisalsi]MBD8505920.1 LacI family DNA-binding transcriptional regulator [Lolliginicoccus lacisalsi]
MSRTPRPRRRVTLASLAAELKISRTTVSNAYNRPDQLSPELRERVLSAAKELGYSGPDPVARSLRTRRADTIGLLLDQPLSYSFRDPAAVDFVAGLANECDAAGRALLIVPAAPDHEPGAAADVVNKASVDGFVAYSVPENDPYFGAAMERHLPLVVCDQPAGIDGTVRVGIDDHAAMLALARIVLDLGHRSIGILAMRLGDSKRDGTTPLDAALASRYSVQRDRIQAIADAAAQQPHEVALTIIETASHTRESGARAAQAALDQDPGITALLCTTDVLALGAMTWAAEHGIVIPDELSVTGFDGTADAMRADLTTVVQPSEEKGQRAGEILMALAPSTGSREELLATSVHHGSTIAAPRRR